MDGSVHSSKGKAVEAVMQLIGGTALQGFGNYACKTRISSILNK
jgi:hypothetical protein